MSFYDYTPVAAPKVRRVSNAFELSGRKRFSDGWQFVASYVWQKLEGNYDGVFQNSTGQLDPNINSAFDYADFLVNADGRLTNDRTHQIKFDGSYEFQSGPTGTEPRLVDLLLLGHAVERLSATRSRTRTGSTTWRRADRSDAVPSEWEANLQAQYPIRFGDNKRLNLIIDVFNLFDRQKTFSSTNATTSAGRTLCVDPSGPVQRRQPAG